MLPRTLEVEVMDTEAEARDYDAMDHAAVNRAFVTDLLAVTVPSAEVLDVGTGTALIPIELCRRAAGFNVVAVDLARHMLELAETNVRRAGLADRIRLELADSKELPYAAGRFAVVMSNSIVHHIPDPAHAVAEMLRVLAPRGTLFVRDLVRPPDESTLQRLVDTYAADANLHQRTMFADSLRAALTLDEVRALVAAFGLSPDDVRPTSDRHWTWCLRR